MIFWQNHTLAKWYCGKTIFWQNHILGYTLAAFQTNTLFKANDFANWLTKEPQFEWQKNNFWSSPEKPQQEHHETNGPPRSPNYLLLSLILIYWYGCAVLFARQGWCKIGACILLSWVPGLRNAAVHEHVLKPCAAHMGFLCKNCSAKFKFEMFWSWNHVSWSFYRFMLRDKRHCSHVCCGLRLAVPLPNKHNYPNCRTDTQYQQEKNTSVASIWLIVFILHSSPVFNFKQ